jgi:exonuclease SbcD
MSGQPFRFLQAGSFALDQPLLGFAEIPKPLEELLIDAPYQAAQKVFDAAIEERVDFVILTGDLLDLARPSPRAIAFLLDNFERLNAHGIATYWAGGRLDPPQDWPVAARLPGGVQLFSALEAEELSHFRGDRPVANLVGWSWHGTATTQIVDINSDADGLPTIVVSYGEPDADRLPGHVVDYWALGGQSERQSPAAPQGAIHYAGSPQGRSPHGGGPHGCTLVHVGGDRAIRMQFIATDAVRWHTERLTINREVRPDDIRGLLADRAKQLRAEAQTRPLIVTWKLSGGEHLAGPAARRDLAAEWQAWLREEFAASADKPLLWTQTVEVDQPQLPACWFDEESMLGEFLRSVCELAALEPEDVNPAKHVPQHRSAAFAPLAEWSAEEQQAVLAEAALTGAQLLGAADREA